MVNPSVLCSCQQSFGQAAGMIERDAFKKEYAFLEAEEAALKLPRSTQTSGKMVPNQAVLAGLQKQIITRTSEADAMAEKLVEVEREVDALGEGAEALTGLLQQISRALQTNGVEWNPVVKALSGNGTKAEQAAEKSAQLAQEAAQLTEGFSLALNSIALQSKIRIESGQFFLADGTKVDGQLIHIGRIAAGASGDSLSHPLEVHSSSTPSGTETALALSKGNHQQPSAFFFSVLWRTTSPRRKKRS